MYGVIRILFLHCFFIFDSTIRSTVCLSTCSNMIKKSWTVPILGVIVFTHTRISRDILLWEMRFSYWYTNMGKLSRGSGLGLWRTSDEEQPVHKVYQKCCVKFRTTPSVRTGFPAVIKHSLSEHLKCLKSKTWNDLTSANLFFLSAQKLRQNALSGKTGGAVIGLRVSKQDGMVFSSSPTCLSLVRVNQPIPSDSPLNSDARIKRYEGKENRAWTLQGSESHK